MKYIYGPVVSRRLGVSLGISAVGYKVCSLNCIYCQLKKTTHQIIEPRKYANEQDILEEVRNFFLHKPAHQKIDYVTFSGSGEPTLHASIGRLIRRVQALTKIPVALITNSTTLLDPKVRRDLLSLDLIVPSLDAVTQDVFEKIDRPARGMKIKPIIEALVEFRKLFKGQLWLEVMLVRGFNDSVVYLKKIKKVVDRIKPDRIQINSPVRPPAEEWVRIVRPQTLKKAKEIFGDICDIV